MKYMSRIVPLLLLLVSPFACRNDHALLSPSSDPDHAYRVSLSEAKSVATSILIGDTVTTSNSIAGARSNVKYLKIKEQYQVKSDDAAETDLYVFNYDEGFAVVSGDKRLLPIIAFSDKSSFTAKTENLGVKDWITSTKNVLKAARKEKIKQSKEAQKAWERFDSSPANPGTGPGAPPSGPDPYGLGGCGNTVGPLIASTWDQGMGYNYSCPARQGGPCGKGLTGCVATTIGQIARYWHYTGRVYYDYNSMEDAVDNTCSPQYGDQQVASLLYNIGDQVSMNWGPDASSASTSNAPRCFRNYFGYSSGGDYTGNIDLTRIAMNLNNGWPLMMRGEGTGAHAWVCDGYVQCSWNLGPGMGSFWSYYHMNWGWGGFCNGWYYYTSLRPSNNGTEIGYDFGSSRAMIANIHP